MEVFLDIRLHIFLHWTSFSGYLSYIFSSIAKLFYIRKSLELKSANVNTWPWELKFTVFEGQLTLWMEFDHLFRPKKPICSNRKIKSNNLWSNKWLFTLLMKINEFVLKFIILCVFSVVLPIYFFFRKYFSYFFIWWIFCMNMSPE